MLNFLKKKATAQDQQLAELLTHTAERLSQPGANVEQGCKVLAQELAAARAVPARVKAIARDVVYSGNHARAEHLMKWLAKYGYGESSVTVQQPERMPRQQEAASEPPNTPALTKTNLLAELARPEPYSAVLLAEHGVGATTLLQALISAHLRHPCYGITLSVADLYGEPSWKGLEQLPEVVVQMPPRDTRFLSGMADLVGQLAREVQSRVAQRTINSRSTMLGSNKWPPYLQVIDGWQNITEELSLLSNRQIYTHKHAKQLLTDFRYCLSTGPKVNVSIVVTADRLDNCQLTETAMESARVFALGAVREGGKGGYRAVEALLNSKQRVPDVRDRNRLQEVLGQCKQERQPVVLALSGMPRLGRFGDFRDPELDLKDLYDSRRKLTA